MIHDATPILIGQGQVTVRGEPLEALSTPLSLMLSAASLACEDAELSRSNLRNLSDLVVVKSRGSQCVEHTTSIGWTGWVLLRLIAGDTRW